MSAESVAAISASALNIAVTAPQLADAMPLAPQSANAVEGGGFSQMVNQGLSQINQQMIASQVDLQQLAVGNVENLHQVMMRLEETRLSFQLAMQVRNRLLEAYQDVMKMPI